MRRITASGFRWFRAAASPSDPAANIASKRKESDVGAPVGKVSTTIEAGAFAGYELTESIHLRAEVLKGLGGHDGVVGTVGADHIWRDGDRYVFSIGPRVLLSNGRYQRAYFGVTPAVALATGLPVYDPGGGVHAVAAASGLLLPVQRPFRDVRLRPLRAPGRGRRQVANRSRAWLAQSAVRWRWPELHVQDLALRSTLRAATLRRAALGNHQSAVGIAGPMVNDPPVIGVVIEGARGAD